MLIDKIVEAPWCYQAKRKRLYHKRQGALCLDEKEGGKRMAGCNYWMDYYRHEEHMDEISSSFVKLEGPLSLM